MSHVRVLDFTQLLQGPLATQVLGDLGADVVKVEKPGGEWMRFWGILASTTDGEMDSFLAFNRNKRSVAVGPQGRQRSATGCSRLGADVDVVVENFRPGVMDRLGLGYDDFAAVNPQIIYASSSGYGQDGPYRDRPGQDLLVQALAGALHLTGRDGDPPTPCGIGISDEYTGLHLVVAILAALSPPAGHRRGPAGRGRPVLLHGRRAAAGADRVPEPRRADAAGEGERRPRRRHRAVRHVPDRATGTWRSR